MISLGVGAKVAACDWEQIWEEIQSFSIFSTWVKPENVFGFKK